jgi:hypothetical protein
MAASRAGIIANTSKMSSPDPFYAHGGIRRVKHALQATVAFFASWISIPPYSLWMVPIHLGCSKPSFKHFGLDYRALKVLIYCVSRPNFGRPHFAPDNRSTSGKRISEKYVQKYRKDPLFNAVRRSSAWPYIQHFFAIGVVSKKDGGRAAIRKNCNTSCSQAARLLAGGSDCSMKIHANGPGASHAF